ncbi:hypothetical protein FTY72_18745 [Salmonella enterica]|nr:hypothetical protein [Salmonella enterica]
MHFLRSRPNLTLAQIQYSAKSEIFVFLTLAQIQYSAKSEIFVFLTLAYMLFQFFDAFGGAVKIDVIRRRNNFSVAGK